MRIIGRYRPPVSHPHCRVTLLAELSTGTTAVQCNLRSKSLAKSPSSNPQGAGKGRRSGSGATARVSPARKPKASASRPAVRDDGNVRTSLNCATHPLASPTWPAVPFLSSLLDHQQDVIQGG